MTQRSRTRGHVRTETRPVVRGAETVWGMEREQGGKHKELETVGGNSSAHQTGNIVKWRFWLSLILVKMGVHSLGSILDKAVHVIINTPTFFFSLDEH